MRTIEYTTQFKKDFRREKKGEHRKTVEALLRDVVELLAADKVLPAKNSDHALVGEWKDHRDRHLKPDLVLIYRKPDAETLQLVRLGSHAELF